MKIALVRARYNPSGGAERFAERAMHALVGATTTVSIIARSWRGGEQSGPGWTILSCNPFYLGSVWRDWSFARAVRKTVEALDFDLVQSHERIPGLPVYRAGDGVHAAWLERRRRSMGWWSGLAIALNPHHHYLRRIERRMFEHPDLRAVICNSTLVAEEIRTRFRIDPTKLKIIPNGVDLERFHPRLRSEHRSSLRTRLGIGETAPLLLFVGSGFERKGLRLALTALSNQAENTQLVVLGRDKHADRYRQLARRLGVAGRVHFIGEVDDPRPFLGAADVLVLPTLYDPFPNVVLESLACGVPVVISDACGAIDLVRNGENGWIHKSGDQLDLDAKLRLWTAMQRQPDQQKELRHRARASVSGYSTQALAQSLLGLYRELLSTPAAEVQEVARARC